MVPMSRSAPIVCGVSARSRTDTFDAMKYDEFSDILRSWPYEPGRLSARLVEREDGPPWLQIRVEFGLLQLESVGRPDGIRSSEEHESLFEVLLDRAGSSTFSLDAAECEALHREAALYSYRSLVFSVLEDYDGVLGDTNRNLQVMHFIVTHAQESRERENALRTRLQLLMMRARALATISVRNGDMSRARSVLDAGLEELRLVMQDLGRVEDFEDSDEVRLLLGMRDMLVPRLPASQRQEMRERLENAIAVENYELAAILTAELRQMP